MKKGYFMSNFASGVITGSIIAAVGVGILMSNSRTRRRMARSHRNAMRKTEDLIEGVTNLF